MLTRHTAFADTLQPSLSLHMGWQVCCLWLHLSSRKAMPAYDRAAGWISSAADLQAEDAQGHRHKSGAAAVNNAEEEDLTPEDGRDAEESLRAAVRRVCSAAELQGEPQWPCTAWQPHCVLAIFPAAAWLQFCTALTHQLALLQRP